MRKQLVALISTAALLSAAPSPADASAPRRSLIPGSVGEVVLEGRGYGHGRGMGQWGARGMATGGASWRTIVRHYYSGVSIDKVSERRRMRVLLSRRRTLTFGPLQTATVRWAGGRARVQPSRLYRVSRRSLQAATSADGPWRQVSRISGTVRMSAAPIVVVTRDGTRRRYEGAIVLQPSGKKFRVVNEVSLSAYLRAVVPREMPASWPQEALKAQTVAARTYAIRVRSRARSIGSPTDICDDQRCQVYGGAAVRRPGEGWRPLTSPYVDAAIRATRGRILTYAGAPILAQYSSSTGGHTINGEQPYLRARRDPWDRASPTHLWIESIRAREIEQAWPSIGRFQSMRILRRDGRGAWGGRARVVLVDGTRRAVRVDADRVRRELGLRSTWFRIARSIDRYRFVRNLGEGTRDVAVGVLQRRLRAGGFFPPSAPISSYFGPITKDSVIRYQRARGIPATGFVGPLTRRALNGVVARATAGAPRYRFTRNLGFGTTHPAVQQLQRRLYEEGVYPGGAPFTNHFGPITKGAVIRYQRAHLLPPTGFVGPRTRARLNA